MRHFFIFSLLCIFLLTGCKRNNDNYQAILPSPGFDIHVYFNLFNGLPFYRIYHHDVQIFEWSELGFEQEQDNASNDMYKMLKLDLPENLSHGSNSEDDLFFKDRKYNVLMVPLASTEENGIAYSIEFRAFEGGMAYRYHYNAKEKFLFEKESSEFIFNADEQDWILKSAVDSLGTVLAYDTSRADFISNTGIQVQIYETAQSASSNLKLVRAEEGKMEYMSRVDAAISATQNKTPWRIIQISNNIPHE